MDKELMIGASIPYCQCFSAALMIHTRRAATKGSSLTRPGSFRTLSNTAMLGSIPGAGGLTLAMDLRGRNL